MKKRILIIVICIVVLITAWTAFCGYQWSWGPFAKLHDVKTASLPGNAAAYSPETVEQVQGSVLEGKTILFLGSSVTYGASSKGVSFADYLEAKYGCVSIKEAVSGTTLVESGTNSYISRLKRLDISALDLLVCQLSTNDATQNKTLGTVSASTDIDDFDTSTVAGAMEYIIAYAEENWGCPVYFYTNSQYDSEQYAAMVELLTQIQEKWGIGVIDLWNDEDFNDITSEQRSLYMADSIHPTQAGYLEWWLPKFEEALTACFEREG
ncbi:MAG: SGNH/GDSL hydrolase family protein [Lachnospiraceae bacterium]|nr:SGNH/GDSL hydrolase family protein [Lachnospiraceae bacterium]